MKLSYRGEISLINHIRDMFSDNNHDILIGIGDDAASININGNNLLITTDMMSEGVHFDFSYSTPYQLGFKLISINVSDIYAMGGEPKYILLSLSFPSDIEESTLYEFLEGVSSATKKYHITLIGGDITSSKFGVTVSASLIGFSDKVITRGGAQIGDRIYITGFLGDSACGLQLLKKIQKPIYIEDGQYLDTPLEWGIMKPLIIRHLMPQVKKTFFNKNKIHSMMDISDGLFIDLKRLCAESNTGAIIYEDKLPISEEMLTVSSYLDINPIEICICGGEDYEYLFTSHEEINYAYCIGEIIKEGFVFVDKRKRENEWIDCGYEHFKVQGKT